MSLDRRSLLIAGAAAAGAHGQPLHAEGTAGSGPMSMLEMARLKSYRAERSSSFDRSGGNNDWVRLDAGASTPILDVKGPGSVTHIWITINSDEPYHLKKLVLRAYWDGETEPSVEAPVGDFFGLTLGEYFLYESALTTVASVKALNAYFVMPFHKSAKITITNEGSRAVHNLYFNVDWISVDELPSDLAYFHAQYRQATPNVAESGSDKNPGGEKNYVYMEAKGRGHFLGVVQGVIQNTEQWFGEGDEMMIVDGRLTINGTGTEDYFKGAWNFGKTAFAYQRNGAPFVANAEHTGGRYCLYRWHLENAIPFRESMKATIEHGHANDRADSYFTTAFWYQTEPHQPFPKLPEAQQRVPAVLLAGSK